MSTDRAWYLIALLFLLGSPFGSVQYRSFDCKLEKLLRVYLCRAV